MAHKGMKKLRQVEKAGLIVLCIVMLGTLGLGSATVFQGCEQEPPRGTFVIDGENFAIDGPTVREYWPFMTYQRLLRRPPAWKFALDPRLDPEFANYQPNDEDLWTFIVLDKLAEKLGVKIPPQAVQDWIRGNFTDPETGRYERELYEAWLRSPNISGVWATASEFEKFLRRYLTVQYFVKIYSPLLFPTNEQVYKQWSVRNRRHDTEYVVQSISALRREVDMAAIPMPEVEAYYGRDRVRRNFRVPTRQEFEAIYLILDDVTDEQFAKLTKKADEKELVKLGPQEGFRHYYANEKGLYRTDRLVERLKKEWEEEQKAKEKEDAGAEEDPADGEDKPADEETEPADEETKPADEETKPADEEKAGATDLPGLDLPELPKKGGFEDPTIGLTPEQKYQKYFKEPVERELYLKKLLARLLMDERIKKKGLAAIATEYGLPHYVTERGLDRFEIYKNEPVGGQELRETLNRMTAGDDGEYAVDVVGIGTGKTRGYAIFKLNRVTVEHFPELSAVVEEKLLRDTLPLMARVEREVIEEGTLADALRASFPDVTVPDQESFKVEEVVRMLLRQTKAEEEATAKLDKVMAAVTAGGQTFRSAAEEKGYRVFTMDGVTIETRMAEPAEPDPGETLTPAQEKQRQLDRHRWFLLKGRSFGTALPLNIRLIADTPSQSFVPQVLLDRETDSAYLVWVNTHVVPAPEEMPEVATSRIRLELMNHNRRTTLRSFFEFDDIVERYSLFVDGVTNREEKKRAAEEKRKAEEGGGE